MESLRFGKCLVQLHKATAGTVEYEGKNIFDLKNEELKKLKSDIQMVFQDPFSSLDPRMTAGKLVEEPMIVHKIIADKKGQEPKSLGASSDRRSGCTACAPLSP